MRYPRRNSYGISSVFPYVLASIFIILLLSLICYLTGIPQMVDYAFNARDYIAATSTAYAAMPLDQRPTATPTPIPTEVPAASWGDTYLIFPEGTEDVIVVHSGSPSSGYAWEDSNYTIITSTYYCLVDGRYRECYPVVESVSDSDR